jgi:UDP-2,3-diacylglucosamine pyrophosphatase LpxH
MAKDRDIIRVRALFLSDVHLGTRGCQANMLLQFLKRYDADTVYLVGDIIDGWKLKSGWFWPQAHNDVVQKLLKKVHRGARLIYVPGNHDEFAREYLGHNFGGIDVMNEAIHVAADGKRYIIMHGDHFDLVVRHAPWLAHIGDGAYSFALWLNGVLNLVRRRLGFSYWSLSAWAKLKVKTAVNHIGRFEELLSLEARRHDCQGVICGHIHHAIIRDIDGVTYMNTGDWVESCTALVEHDDGQFEIIRWSEEIAQVHAVEEAARALRRQVKASAA